MTSVTICDVGPRDGLQNEPEILPAATRAELVDRLAAAGLPRIEAASFVETSSCRKWPAPRTSWLRSGGGRERSTRGSCSTCAAWSGCARPPSTAVQLHTRCHGDVQPAQRGQLAGPGGCAGRGDPRRGRPAGDGDAERRLRLPVRGPCRPGRRRRALAARSDGADEICLADTIGVATPSQVAGARRTRSARPVSMATTRATPGTPTRSRRSRGRRLLDASVGGLGGCPFSPHATGNIATEDLVYLLEHEGIATGIDLDALIAVARWLAQLLGRELPGYVYRAERWPPPR